MGLKEKSRFDRAVCAASVTSRASFERRVFYLEDIFVLFIFSLFVQS
eukprot:COSAG02_NODE_21893_length_771_cov_0.979167_2_plen_46_part_01